MAKKPPADPQSCESCRFFLGNKTDDAGYCRRYPPTPIADDEGIASVVAVTTSADWCGEYVRVTH